MCGKIFFTILTLLAFACFWSCDYEDSGDSGSLVEAPVDDDDLTPADDDDDNDDSGDDTGTIDPAELIDLFTLDNELIRVEIDRNTGHVVQITDLTKNPPLSLLTGASPEQADFAPFRILEFDPFFSKSPDKSKDEICEVEYPPRLSFCDPPKDNCRKLTWTCDPGVTFEGKIELVADKAAVDFYGQVLTNGGFDVLSFFYPLIAPFDHLSDDPSKDTLAIPYEGGALIYDPVQRAREEKDRNFQFLSKLIYPDGHKLMMQMISYQSEQVGGFLFYTPDANFTKKLFHVSDLTPNEDEPSVGVWIEHVNWDALDDQQTGGMAVDYPTRIEAIGKRGTWQTAAKIYREWGERQLWASSPIVERVDDDRLLFETSALSVFGISAREDQTEWYRAFHDQFCDGIDEARVLFVPGWDFHPNGELEGEPTFAFYQGGWNEMYWLPYQGAFVDNYLVMKQEHDDFVYPFLYDLLVHDGFPGWDGWTGTAMDSGDLGAPWLDHQLISMFGSPGGLYRQFSGFPGYTHILDPVDQDVIDFYLWRHELIADTYQNSTHLVMDGMYHDVSVTFTTDGSYDSDHDYPMVGAGRWLVEAARNLHSELLGPGPGRDFSIGIENITEPFINQIDFYHLGDVGLGPLRGRNPNSASDAPEFDGVNRWFMEGQMWDIPLFAYVYHPFGAMRTGGKIQISYEMGDLFFWAAASEYLWGGLIELIYFNASMDILPGIDPDNVPCPDGWPCGFKTGWATGPNGNQLWEYDENSHLADPAKIEFMRKAAYLRITAAPEYLATGRMLHPPDTAAPIELVDYDYDFYSHILGENYNHTGVYSAPSLIVTAWEPYEGGRPAIFLANPTGDNQSVDLVFDPVDYDLDSASATLVDVEEPIGADQWLKDCESGSDCEIPVSIEPFSFAMIRL